MAQNTQEHIFRPHIIDKGASGSLDVEIDDSNINTVTI